MRIAAFIPNKISSKTVAGFLDLLRRIQRRLHIAVRICKKHMYENRMAVDRMLGSFGENRDMACTGRPFLESQNSYGSIAYGRSDMAYAGCEVIAAYNALISLGMRVDLSELIRDFEKDGMVLSGRFGTAPYAIRDHLKMRGLKIDTEFDPEMYDDVAAASDVSILMLYNDRRSVFKKIHTVCLTRDHKGYSAHNLYGDGRCRGPYKSVSEFIGAINEGYAKGIVLFGIKRPGET